MRLNDVEIRDVRPLLDAERAHLLVLLASLSDAEWVAPTEAGPWAVKDVALHLLDDDLGCLSRGRDSDASGLLDATGDYREFVAALDAKNQRWVDGASGLSRQVVTGLLLWSGQQTTDYFASLDLRGSSNVIWADDEAVPRWFDLAREFTERWVHQQHIRDAVGKPGTHERFLPEVLRTFVWAFPHQYQASAPIGTAVVIDMGGAGTWTLTRQPTRWDMSDEVPNAPAAALRIPPNVAWRQLTGLAIEADQYRAEGDQNLINPLLHVRGIIA